MPSQRSGSIIDSHCNWICANGSPCRSWAYDVNHLPAVHRRHRAAGTSLRRRQPAQLRQALALTARVTAAFARRSPAAVALALGTVYLVWGSTYLAIRVTDRTLPPLLMSSVRFLIAGAALYAFASRGRARPTRREWTAAAITGAALLLVGNGGVAWAETRLDSGFAALIVAIIPLYVALFDRVFFGRRLSPVAIARLVVGFVGVALLVRPGGGNNVGVALVLVATTSAWAAGSLYARGAPLPSSPLLSASMQMLSAALFLGIAGLAGGEANDVHMSSFTLKPLLAFAYLVVVGSLIAFSA